MELRLQLCIYSSLLNKVVRSPWINAGLWPQQYVWTEWKIAVNKFMTNNSAKEDHALLTALLFDNLCSMYWLPESHSKHPLFTFFDLIWSHCTPLNKFDQRMQCILLKNSSLPSLVQKARIALLPGKEGLQLLDNWSRCDHIVKLEDCKDEQKGLNFRCYSFYAVLLAP